MLTGRNITRMLAALRDGWLVSVAGTGLIPGPFLTAGDIHALETSTGWSGPHLAEAVRRAFSPFDDDALATLTGAADAGRESHMLAILAGRVPALAAKVLFHGLCAGVGVTLKPSSAEPVFTGLLVKSANTIMPEVLVSIAPSDRGQLDDLVGTVPICLVYGSDETVASVLAARPDLPTLTGPHMESFCIVFASAISTPAKALVIADKIALDTAIYDQSGCLSPVAVLVQNGGRVTVPEFAGLLLDALLQNPLKTGTYSPDALSPLRLFLQESTLKYGRGAVLTGPDGIPPAIVLCDRVRPVPGFRTLQVSDFATPVKGSVDSILVPDLGDYLPHLKGRVQGMSVAGDGLETTLLLDANPDYRPNYLCRPGRLQDPPAAWPENGVVLAHVLRRR